MSTVDHPGQHLLDRVRSGDRDAFEVLFRAHFPALLRFARAHVREPADAEDVVHDVFLRLWRDPSKMTADRSVRAYLLSAVRHRVIDLARHRQVEARWLVTAPSGQSEESEHVLGFESMVGRAATDSAALAELDEAIQRSVAALPERCRTAFLLCREQELTYAEAAQVMGVAPATVKTQVARALSSLRTALEPYLAILLAVGSIAR